MVECIRLESEQTVKGLGSSNLPLSSSARAFATSIVAAIVLAMISPASANASSTISGRVVRSDSNAAIEDAIVTVLVPSGTQFVNVVPDVRSHRDGSFSSLGISETDVIVSIAAKNFASLVCRYRLSPGGVVRGNFTLQATANVALPSESSASCPQAPIDGGHIETVYDVR